MSGCVVIAAISIGLAFVLLIARDADRRHYEEADRSDADRIAAIINHAHFMALQLMKILERHDDTSDRSAQWIPTVLDFYIQVETLASVADSSVESCDRLADDASHYVRERRLKGITVERNARSLSAMLRRRATSQILLSKFNQILKDAGIPLAPSLPNEPVCLP